MISEPADFSKHADHPRFGREPQITGLNPDPMNPDVQLHWHTISHEEMVKRYEFHTEQPWPYGNLRRAGERRIPFTAILADPSQYAGDPCYSEFTHYFDLQRKCRDCKRLFIFFAQEQKYWYEVLKLPLEADAVHCVACRKRRQRITQNRKRFEALSHVEEKTTSELIEMAECCLAMIEIRIFSPRQLQRVRMLLNRIPADSDSKALTRKAELREWVVALEERGNGRGFL